MRKAEFSVQLRLGASENNMLAVLANLASSYEAVGQTERALKLLKNVYARRLKLHGEEDERTLRAANNYASSLHSFQREEAKALLRKGVPVARRILGEGHRLTLKIRWIYARALINAGGTLDDLREAVTTLVESERTARRVFGGAHPITEGIEAELQDARAALRARETPPRTPG